MGPLQNRSEAPTTSCAPPARATRTSKLRALHLPLPPPASLRTGVHPSYNHRLPSASPRAKVQHILVGKCTNSPGPCLMQSQLTGSPTNLDFCSPTRSLEIGCHCRRLSGWPRYGSSGLPFPPVASWLQDGCHGAGPHLHPQGGKKERPLRLSFLSFFLVRKVLDTPQVPRSLLLMTRWPEMGHMAIPWLRRL